MSRIVSSWRVQKEKEWIELKLPKKVEKIVREKHVRAIFDLRSKEDFWKKFLGTTHTKCEMLLGYYADVYRCNTCGVQDCLPKKGKWKELEKHFTFLRIIVLTDEGAFFLKGWRRI